VGRIVSSIKDTIFGRFSVVETFAERVRRLREGANLSLADVASRVGHSVQWVSAIETGRLKEPGIFAGVKLARTLKVTLEELVFGQAGSQDRTIAQLDGDVPADVIPIDGARRRPEADARLRRVEEAVKELPGLTALVTRLNGRVEELLAERTSVKEPASQRRTRRAPG